MPEVGLEQDTSNDPVFVTDPPPTEESVTPEPTQPAPETTPEPEPSGPDWLTAPLTESRPQQSQPQPQYIPVPVPQYIPQLQYVPQAQPQPNYTLEQFVQDPTLPVKVAKQELMQQFAPVVQELQQTQQRLRQLDDFGRRQHEASVANAFDQTRSAIKEQGYNKIFSQDPAYRNPAVKERVDAAIKGYLLKATEQAHVYGDFSAYANAARPAVMKAILQWAKEEAGWSPETSQPIKVQGGMVETGRPQPQPTRADVDEDLRDAARKMGIDESRLAKALDERKKLWGI